MAAVEWIAGRGFKRSGPGRAEFGRPWGQIGHIARRESFGNHEGHVYDAVLHVGAGHDHSQSLSGAPLRLEIRYRRGFTAEEIVRGGDTLLLRNVSAETLQSLRPRLDRLNRAYREIKPGDRYTLTYLPGRGTNLRLNDTELVTIEGADFAEAYFRIWPGDNPISPALRDQLLGR